MQLDFGYVWERVKISTIHKFIFIMSSHNFAKGSKQANLTTMVYLSQYFFAQNI